MAFTVNVKPTGVEVGFEVGSLAEAVSVLQGEENALTTLMGITFAVRDGAEGQAPAEPAKRGRKPKSGPDPSTAVAPPPAPVPPAPVPASNDGIPDFLDRNKGAKAPAGPPAPPPLVGAPPPPAAPGGVLAEKVIAECTKRAAAAPDKGAALADWLSAHGLVVKGASFDEAIAVLRMLPDDKLKPAADQLGVV